MNHSITLAVDVPADPARVFETLSTTEGQPAFWTTDCDVSADRARFGFAQGAGRSRGPAIHATGTPGRFFWWATPLMARQVRASITGDLERLRACPEPG